jgi:dihydrofolate reductase
MKKIIVSMYVSVDGVTESPEKWSVKFWNDDIANFKHAELFSVEALLLGRVTYEVFAGSWPTRKGDPYSDRINSMSKYVVSTTLESVGWNGSRMITGGAASEIAALKQQPGGDLLVFGSMTLVDTLMRHGLVDEYRLLVYPVVLGGGQRLFKDGSSERLKLTETQRYGPDVVLLRYVPAA